MSSAKVLATKRSQYTRDFCIWDRLLSQSYSGGERPAAPAKPLLCACRCWRISETTVQLLSRSKNACVLMVWPPPLPSFLPVLDYVAPMLPSRLTSIWKAAHMKQNTAGFTFVEDDTRGIWLLGASRNSGFSSSTPVCGPNPNYRKRGAFATEAPQCGGTVSKPNSVSPGYSVRSSMPVRESFCLI